MAREIRREHEQETVSEPCIGLQGEGGARSDQGDQPNIEWKDQLLEGATSAFPTSSGTKPSTPEVDIKALHAKIGELTLRKNPVRRGSRLEAVPGRVTPLFPHA